MNETPTKHSDRFHQDKRPRAEVTWDPPSMPQSGGVASTTISIASAALGDFVIASLTTLPAADILISAHVQAAGVVRVILKNESGSVQDLPSGTLRIRLLKKEMI